MKCMIVSHRIFRLFTLLAASLLAAGPIAAAAAEPDQQPLWTSGEGGYYSYRIPSLIVTGRGTLLAFCEARKNSRSDTGRIDLVFRRSTDGGKSWGPQQVLWADGENTCGNPCPVVDHTTGTVWLLLTHNLGRDDESEIKSGTADGTRTVWVSRSNDDGETWSPPVDITASAKNPKWGWYATGPGIGIQIQHGPHKGRLIVPCDYTIDERKPGEAKPRVVRGSHAIYSDDHGQTWKLGGTIAPDMNECQVVELAGGRGELLMNMRSYRGKSRRGHARSTDGGKTWSEAVDVPELIEPVCQASILRGAWPKEDDPGLLLFSNPADGRQRIRLTVRTSRDEGKSWNEGRVLHAGPAAYSCLAALDNGTFACLYERGEKSAYDTITFARFSREWVNGASNARSAK